MSFSHSPVALYKYIYQTKYKSCSSNRLNIGNQNLYWNKKKTKTNTGPNPGSSSAITGTFKIFEVGTCEIENVPLPYT